MAVTLPERDEKRKWRNPFGNFCLPARHLCSHFIASVRDYRAFCGKFQNARRRATCACREICVRYITASWRTCNLSGSDENFKQQISRQSPMQIHRSLEKQVYPEILGDRFLHPCQPGRRENGSSFAHKSGLPTVFRLLLGLGSRTVRKRTPGRLLFRRLLDTRYSCRRGISLWTLPWYTSGQQEGHSWKCVMLLSYAFIVLALCYFAECIYHLYRNTISEVIIHIVL